MTSRSPNKRLRIGYCCVTPVPLTVKRGLFLLHFVVTSSSTAICTSVKAFSAELTPVKSRTNHCPCSYDNSDHRRKLRVIVATSLSVPIFTSPLLELLLIDNSQSLSHNVQTQSQSCRGLGPQRLQGTAHRAACSSKLRHMRELDANSVLIAPGCSLSQIPRRRFTKESSEHPRIPFRGPVATSKSSYHDWTPISDNAS